MSEERLQEIKDSISLQYKVQEANDLDNFNIFTDEEQELVDEIERLNKRNKEIYEGFMATTKELTEYAEEVERLNNIIDELEKYLDEDDWTSVNGEIAVRLIKLKLQELKGSDKE